MSDYEDKQGTWPAIYFIRDDLNKEKSILISEMSDMGWTLTEQSKDRLKEISTRIEEINDIIRKVTMNMYTLEE